MPYERINVNPITHFTNNEADGDSETDLPVGAWKRGGTRGKNKRLTLTKKCSKKPISEKTTRGTGGMSNHSGGSGLGDSKNDNDSRLSDDELLNQEITIFGYAWKDRIREEDDQIIERLEHLCRIAVQEGITSVEDLGEELIQAHLRDLSEEDDKNARERLEAHFDQGCEHARDDLANEKRRREGVRNRDERDLVIEMTRVGIKILEGADEGESAEDWDFFEVALHQLPLRLNAEIRTRVNRAVLNNLSKQK